MGWDGGHGGGRWIGEGLGGRGEEGCAYGDMGSRFGLWVMWIMWIIFVGLDVVEVGWWCMSWVVVVVLCYLVILVLLVCTVCVYPHSSSIRTLWLLVGCGILLYTMDRGMPFSLVHTLDHTCSYGDPQYLCIVHPPVYTVRILGCLLVVTVTGCVVTAGWMDGWLTGWRWGGLIRRDYYHSTFLYGL